MAAHFQCFRLEHEARREGAELNTCKTPPQNDDVSTAATELAPCLVRNPIVQTLELVSIETSVRLLLGTPL
jgi:hypothetical protein